VRKGVIGHHPANPNYVVYTSYIRQSDLYVYSQTSSDGGNTWSSPTVVSGHSFVRDLVLGVSGTGYTGGLFIDNAGDDSGAGSRVVTSRLVYEGSSWDYPVAEQIPAYSLGLRRLPSVVRTTGNEYLFGVGIDNYGGNVGNDTNAYSLFWAGTDFSGGPVSVGLSSETDNPTYCQQVAFDPEVGTMYYLYFDNHMEYETDGGDIFVIQGSYPATCSGPAETRVVNVGSNQRPSQGYLFKNIGGDFIFLYALEEGPPANPTANTLYLRVGPGLNDLQYSTDILVESALGVPTNTNSRYRTLYAAQDGSGTIHVVWQDASGTIKWSKIQTANPPYTPTTPVTLANNRWLDSISVGEMEMYVSMVEIGSFNGEVLKVPLQ